MPENETIACATPAAKSLACRICGEQVAYDDADADGVVRCSKGHANLPALES